MPAPCRDATIDFASEFAASALRLRNGLYLARCRSGFDDAAPPLRAMNKLPAVLCACAILGGCASSPHDGRAQLTVPTPMSAVYSEVNLQLMLVTRADAPNRCIDPVCALWDGFDQRVTRIGPDLAKAAYEHYPDLRGRVNNFEFIVADKSEPGTVSTSMGRIIILRPVSALAPTDAALAFIVARELGHVVAKHHEENVAAALIVSGLMQIIAPVTSLARVFSNFFVAGTASTSASASAAANATVTASSFVGSRVLVTAYKPMQRDEADAIAMKLLAHLGYDVSAVVAAFAPVNLKSPATEWTSGLRTSVERLSAQSPLHRSVVVESMAGEPPQALASEDGPRQQ